MLTLSHCTVDLERRVVLSEQGSAPLTTREAELLSYLHTRGGPVSRAELLTCVWGYSASAISRTVDNTVARLRNKIERDPANPEHLLTEYGVGYRLALPSAKVQPAAAPERDRPMLVLSEIRVDLDTGEVLRPDGRERLKGLELSLLRELVRSAGPLQGRVQLERRVWGSVLLGSSRLENLVCRLRARIERDPADPKHLITVRGHGYRFVLPAQAPCGGEVTALAVDLSVPLGEESPEHIDEAAERLWAIATGAASAEGGYPTGLMGGRVGFLFPTLDSALAAAKAIALGIPGVQLGLAIGPVRRFVHPLSRRAEYLGPALDAALHMCTQEGLNIDPLTLSHPSARAKFASASQRAA